MAAPVLLRQVLLNRVRFQKINRFAASTLPASPNRLWCSAALNTPSDQADEKLTSESSSTTTATTTSLRTAKEQSSSFRLWKDDPDYRKWKDKEEEILRDIQPIVLLTKDILHSGRYMDGERLTVEDEKAIVEKLLAYHPHSDDKIGCGLESIMVDRHPQFRHSRCLFVVRTDGGWIDFSYQKCLREYIRDKYPNHAEKFIREHFKRGSD